MGKEILSTGIALTIIGILLLILTKLNAVGLTYGTLSLVFGLILIFFNKEEEKLERRKDIKTSKSK